MKHDTGYKLLFSHPEMVRDLLCDWVPGDWLAEADFSTLERMNASYVAENEKERHDDMVWRLRLRDRWLWVYLVLEFQSEADRWMALRMLVYAGLLAQDLVRRGELSDGKLPPILPVVLYNGQPMWSAPTNVRDLFVAPPPGLADHQPNFAYHLIDEARLRLHPATSVRNAVEALFRLEHGRSPDELRRVIQALDALLRDPQQQPMRRSFTNWIKRLLHRKAASTTLSAMATEIDAMSDFMEADSMLAERIETWFEEATQRGLQQGIQQGIQQGRVEGRHEGEAHLLARLLAQRFGPLPEWVDQRLKQASEDELSSWGEAVLSAPTLAAVFGERQR